ncbi:hypothetical protein L7F22_051195 [Adiantum nelumboides]|nr:hypothetical protein [Adiantum nelumboides]
MHVLHEVQYVHDARRSSISISQLRDHGCHVELTDESYLIRRGFLVLAQGHRGAHLSLLHVLGVRDAIVSVSLLPCRRSQSRRVHFDDEEHDALLVVHVRSKYRHVDQDNFLSARLEQSSVVVTDFYALPVKELRTKSHVQDSAVSETF